MRTATVKSGIVLAASLALQSLALSAEFSGGTGLPGDPYRIETAEQLASIGSDPNLLDKHFLLLNDIDLDPNLPGGRVFTQPVIAPEAMPFVWSEGSGFTGVFDGGGHEIRHLKIQGGADDFIGLFGIIGRGGWVHNLHIKDVSVSGMDGHLCVGALAGYIEDCTITMCSATGRVTAGTNAGYCGGLVGLAWFSGRITQCSSACEVHAGTGSDDVGAMAGGNGGRISNCYATGNVSCADGCNRIGGFVGVNYPQGRHKGLYSRGYIIHCYAAGAVSAGPNSDFIGGLVGDAGGSSAIDGFWDVETSGVSTSDGGAGLTTAQIHDATTFIAAGWDLAGERANGTADYWLVPEAGGYPELTALSTTFVPRQLPGSGTTDDPYKIASAEDLGTICHHGYSACYELVGDIDLSDITWAAAPIPIFDGTFDGAGFVVSGLDIQGHEDGGLFRILENSAQVSNLGIEDANIVGGPCIGGLAGQNYGAVADCFVRGNVSGTECVGVLVGFNFKQGVIIGCGTTGSVSGVGYVSAGGLVGANSGLIRNCYAGTEVAAHGSLGSLVGGNGGYIYGCHASGQVSGKESLGGLVGYNSGTIASSYAAVEVLSSEFGNRVGGLVGDASRGKITRCYSVGTILEEGETLRWGGLIGIPYGSGLAVTDCFWDVETSRIHLGHGARGLTSAQMMDPDTYSLNGWASDPNWVLDPGNDYPRLAWEGQVGRPIPDPVIDWFDGTGTQEDPFIIVSAAQLARIGTASILWDKAFVLVSDVDLTGINFPPIGVFLGTDFSGTFDGGAHGISNLAIDTGNMPTLSQGMFGYIGPEGQVQNVILKSATVFTAWGSSGIGLLAGANQGYISDCSVSGSISSGRFRGGVGGLVGYNHRDAEISRSCAAVDISGEDRSRYFGGLVGSSGGRITSCFATGNVVCGHESEGLGGLAGLSSGELSNSYATGSVTAGDKSLCIGGLVGLNRMYGTITTCYSMGNVSSGDASYRVRAFVGENDGWSKSAISNCFWDNQTSGFSESRYGTGLPTAQMQTAGAFLDAGWDFVGETANGTEDVWWILEGKDYPRLYWELVDPRQ